MKIIQLSLILALISSIVTEDEYVVVKLPHGHLAEGAEGAKGDDYWANPWAYPWASGGMQMPPPSQSPFICSPYSTIVRVC